MKTIDKWYMSNDEIRRSWRQAADLKEQVKIIAELNARSKEDVLNKLIALGEAVPEDIMKASKGRKAKYKISEADERKIWQERQKGTPYWKIVRMLGGSVTEGGICNKYDKLRGDYIKALPTVKRALQTVAEAAPRHIISDDDRETIRRFIRRYL